MLEMSRKYRQTMQHEHGWEVEITCPVCAAVAIPVFNGWNPTRSIRLGDRPTIFANLNCPKCAAAVKNAAETKLRELFANEPVPESNRRVRKWYFIYAIASSLIVVVSVAAFVIAGRRIPLALLTAVLVPVALLRPLGSWLNYKVACHRKRCDWGDPAYKFMGLLGRTYCFRCSSCGRQLRLRD